MAQTNHSEVTANYLAPTVKPYKIFTRRIKATNNPVANYWLAATVSKIGIHRATPQAV